MRTKCGVGPRRSSSFDHIDAMNEDKIELLSEADIPFTIGGTMKFQCYLHHASATEVVALVAGRVDGEATHVRIHDACLTSEVFGSCKCDCKVSLISATVLKGEAICSVVFMVFITGAIAKGAAAHWCAGGGGHRGLNYLYLSGGQKHWASEQNCSV